jgi:hypothetical protein
MNQTFQEFWSKNKKIFQLLKKQKGVNHYQALWEARSQELDQLKEQNLFLQKENANLLRIRIESEKLFSTLGPDLERAQNIIQRQNNDIDDMKCEMEQKEFKLLKLQAELDLANIYQKKMRQFNSQMENNLVEKQRQLENLL